jgi:hypothetical protein
MLSIGLPDVNYTDDTTNNTTSKDIAEKNDNASDSSSASSGVATSRSTILGKNRLFDNSDATNLIFLSKRDPRRKDSRFYGRLRVIDVDRQAITKRKRKSTKSILSITTTTTTNFDSGTSDDTNDVNSIPKSDTSIVETIPETPRPIIGMSYTHCMLFIKSTIDRILYGRLVSLVTPPKLNWRVALDRCTAFLMSQRQESDAVLANINIEEDLDVSRKHLAEFFANGFNDW